MADEATKLTFQDVRTIAADMVASRESWLSKWSELSEFIDPKRGRFNESSPNDGKKRHSKIYNSTATFAARTLASGMFSGLTNPSRPWFVLRFEQDELQANDAAKRWLQAVERKIYAALSSEKSNFYPAVQTLYNELAVFNTAAMFHEDLPGKDGKQIFKVLTCGTYAIAEGDSGRVDMLYRELWLSAREILKKYPQTASKHTRQLVENRTPNILVKICHLVMPREAYEVGKLGTKNMPFASFYWEDGAKDDDGFLDESGFYEFPFHVVRYDTTNEEVYGRGPSEDALADVKSLQEQDKAYLVAVQQGIDPALIGPDTFKDRISRAPGAINRVASILGGAASDTYKRLFEVNLDLDHLYQAILAREDKIRRSFFNDLFFAMVDKPGMTATEVVQRTAEKLLQLGPVVERQEFELLSPVIERCFRIMERDGVLPQPPEDIMGQNIKVEYVSMMAQAQRSVAVGSLQGVVQFAGFMAGSVPEVMDRIDTDEALQQYADTVGAPLEILRSDNQVSAIREGRRQAQAEQAQAQQATEAVRAAELMSRTDLSGNNLLAASMGGGEGAGAGA